MGPVEGVPCCAVLHCVLCWQLPSLSRLGFGGDDICLCGGSWACYGRLCQVVQTCCRIAALVWPSHTPLAGVASCCAVGCCTVLNQQAALDKVLGSHDLMGAPLLVVANKQVGLAVTVRGG
jgi:hypothetical protein